MSPDVHNYPLIGSRGPQHIILTSFTWTRTPTGDLKQVSDLKREREQKRFVHDHTQCKSHLTICFQITGTQKSMDRTILSIRWLRISDLAQSGRESEGIKTKQLNDIWCEQARTQWLTFAFRLPNKCPLCCFCFILAPKCPTLVHKFEPAAERPPPILPVPQPIPEPEPSAEAVKFSNDLFQWPKREQRVKDTEPTNGFH